jgi:hypothetical protein
LKFRLAPPQATCYDDSTLGRMSAVRLNEIANLSVQNATENAGRASAMFGVRAAQTNPIEAHAIGALERSATPGNAANTGLAGSLAAMLMNIANRTPNGSNQSPI